MFKASSDYLSLVRQPTTVWSAVISPCPLLASLRILYVLSFLSELVQWTMLRLSLNTLRVGGAFYLLVTAGNANDRRLGFSVRAFSAVSLINLRSIETSTVTWSKTRIATFFCVRAFDLSDSNASRCNDSASCDISKYEIVHKAPRVCANGTLSSNGGLNCQKIGLKEWDLHWDQKSLNNVCRSFHICDAALWWTADFLFHMKGDWTNEQISYEPRGNTRKNISEWNMLFCCETVACWSRNDE